MKKLLIPAIALAGSLSMIGCGSTKSRSVEAKGMWVSDSGQMAIGQVQVDAVPEQVDSAIIHYAEDTAWLSPSTKTHKIDVVLTGTNSTTNASAITKAICQAFVTLAPQLAQTEAAAPKGKTVLDTVEHNRTASQFERLAKRSSVVADSSAPSGCADGGCTDGSCPNGTCSATQATPQ